MLRPVHQFSSLLLFRTSSSRQFLIVGRSRYRLTTPHLPPLLTAFRLFASQAQDFYSIIGVPKSATQSDIKKAYFKKAKECHPDLNPNDKNAVKRFQDLATAYETLGDPAKRAEYDRVGYQRYTDPSSRYGQQYRHAPDANDVFNSVYEDFEIIQSALYDCIDDMKEEFSYALKEADKNNWTPLYKLARANSLLIAGIVLPIALVFRVPTVVAAASRFIIPIISSVGIAIIRSGNSHVVAGYVWRKIVQIARERNKRKNR